MVRLPLLFWLSLIGTLMLPNQFVVAQQYPALNGRQFPLNQMTPPGTAAQWAEQLGRATPEYFQPVRITLPTTGVVTFYEGLPDRGYNLEAPAQAALVVGRVYRLRVSGMPEFPGVEFFPSIELIDRLHPPAGKADQFPVEFELTAEELEWAANDRLVTKVVYLEQPNRVPVTLLDSKERITTVEPFKNVIAEADVLGRPIAIVRMGGRTPDANQPDPGFYGPGGPIRISEPASQTTSKARRMTPTDRPISQAGVFTVRSARKIAQR